jgi:phosphoglucomutase
VKFGLDDGGVLAGDEAKGLIASYRALLESPDAAEKARELMRACPIPALRSCFESVSAEKTASLASYRAFTRHIVSAHADPSRADSFFRDLERSIASFASGGTPLTLATDFNGSARASSIDRSVFGELGIPFFEINGATGAIAHRIVPEGESLIPCADFLSSLKKGVTPEERGVVFGYVPDCDGDRGNIVYWDEGDSQPRILEAQEVFALSVVSELASLAREGLITVAGKGLPCAPPAAVAVNDPTSARIDAIARAFGVRVARAEVGEANVVGLARKLRDEGHVVRILGEGSNGGNITYPSSVRDPLDTVFALLKLLVLRDDGGKKGLFRLWCELSGRMDAYRDDFTFADIRASLPDYSTTSAFEEEAKLAVRTQDHAELKRRFQGVFLREWEARERDLARDFGIVSWQARAYNGMEERDSCRDFSLGRSGGLKILLLGKDREELGFLWMRPSGTESVFRIMAEAAGSDRSRERFLLSWLSRMVLEADSQIV